MSASAATGAAPAERRAARPSAPAGRRPAASLSTRVISLNAAILAAAAALLIFTPASVSFPVALDQGLIVGVGLVVLIVANVVLVRISFRGLDDLVQRMETLDVLRPPQRLPEVGAPETRTLVEGFNRMLVRLEEERRHSAERAFSALEGERRRVGQELHDEIGQRLTGILLQLGRVAEDAPEPVRERLGGVQEETRATLDEVGALAWQLRPAVLDDLGLLRGLEALVETLGERSDTRVVLSLPATLGPLAPQVELAVYRVAQESLINALRHARAATVELTLRPDEDGLRLEIVDDGRGLPADEAEGPGLRGMRERALLIGGRLRIDSSGGGVRVRLDVPRAGPGG